MKKITILVFSYTRLFHKSFIFLYFYGRVGKINEKWKLKFGNINYCVTNFLLLGNNVTIIIALHKNLLTQQQKLWKKKVTKIAK